MMVVCVRAVIMLGSLWHPIQQIACLRCSNNDGMGVGVGRTTANPSGRDATWDVSCRPLGHTDTYVEEFCPQELPVQTTRYSLVPLSYIGLSRCDLSVFTLYYFIYHNSVNQQTLSETDLWYPTFNLHKICKHTHVKFCACMCGPCIQLSLM